MDVHPAIAKRIEELLARAKELVAAQEQSVEILAKTIDIKDVYGLKMRAAEMNDLNVKLQWVVAQLEAIRSLPYDMAAEEMSPKRRISTSTLPAVYPPNPEKKEG